MAKFSTSVGMIDSIANELKNLGAEVENALGDEILDAGAEVAVTEWKNEIQRNGHVKTGDMLNSVKAKKVSNSKRGNVREIFPQGKDRKGVRNAEKARVLSNGTSKKTGSHFADTAEKNAETKSVIRMQAVFDEYLKQKGLV